MVSESIKVQVWQISADAAEVFLHAAYQASPFTQPKVLAALSHKVDYWCASVDGDPACVWPVACDEQGQPSLPLFSYYLGPYWAKSNASLSSRKLMYLTADVSRALAQRLLL